MLRLHDITEDSIAAPHEEEDSQENEVYIVDFGYLGQSHRLECFANNLSSIFQPCVSMDIADFLKHVEHVFGLKYADIFQPYMSSFSHSCINS